MSDVAADWRIGLGLGAKARGAFKDMAGNIGLQDGQISIGNMLQALALVAFIWFGSVVTGDHDSLKDIANDLKSVKSSQQQVAALQQQLTTTAMDAAYAKANAANAVSIAQKADMEARVEQSKIESMRNELAELRGMMETKPKKGK